MERARVLLLCALAPLVAVACSELKSAEINVHVYGPDGGKPGSGDDGPGPGDDEDADLSTKFKEPADAGAPPDDFSCEKDYWIRTDKKRADCAARRVFVVTPTTIIDSRGVSIARTSSGRVGISFNYDQDADTSKLRIAHFTPSEPTFATPTIVTRESYDFQQVGYQSRIVASGSDTFHVLSYDRDPGPQTGRVTSQTLVGDAPLTSPEELVTDVGASTELGFAIDSVGMRYALVRTANGADKAKLLAFSKYGDTPWTALPNLPNLGYGLLPNEAPGVGASSLVIDNTDRLHVLYQHNEVRFGSTPRYHLLGNAAWSYRKTIDNNVFAGWAGFSPRLAVFGKRKYALYFYNKVQGDTPSPTAELRLSTWVTEDDQPQHEVVDQQIPSTTKMYPRYAAAMAVDKYGLLHLAIVRPSPNEQLGYLEYRRQARVEGGGTRWINDIIDNDVLSPQQGATVDLVVDENARPHIAYVSGKDLKLRYATRFDR